MSTAREHAVMASQLLDNLAAADERLRSLTPDEFLQAQVTGGVARANRNMDYTTRLAGVHALTALALVHTEDG